MPEFLSRLARIANTGQSRAILLTGNVHDLFYDGSAYVPLTTLLVERCAKEPEGGERGIAPVLYRPNQPVRFADAKHTDWLSRAGWPFGRGKGLLETMAATAGNPTLAFELLRQLAVAIRRGKSCYDLFFLVESADLLIPETDAARMDAGDRHRVALLQEWFADPEFLGGGDTVVLIADTPSAVNRRITRMPQVLAVEAGLPSLEERLAYLDFRSRMSGLVLSDDEVRRTAERSAGLSLHALRQYMCAQDFIPAALNRRVEDFLAAQLGDGVVEFKRPVHKLDDVVGFSRLKEFLRQELIPGIRSGHLFGAAFCGPIGGGKSFIGEAVAGELDMPVLVLKNLRSKWYGDTDAIFDRLLMTLRNFHRLMIFVDEADTVFGGVTSEHDTERRLSGKIQAMMSDPEFFGKTFWLLMTARIHRLSPDIRRYGRMDLIIPILDPEGEDRSEFVRWAFGALCDESTIIQMQNSTTGLSPAGFAALRRLLAVRNVGTLEATLALADDLIDADLEDVRQYQSIQAKLNCTRRSLLNLDGHEAFDNVRRRWRDEASVLEGKGVS